MLAPGSIPNPKPGDRIRAAHIHELSAALRRSQIHFHPAQFQVSDGPVGRTVSLLAAPPIEIAGTRADPFTTGEGTATADTSTWTIHEQEPGEAGILIPLLARIFYDDTIAYPILYAFYRTLTFDFRGRLVAISAETRYTVDATDAC